MDRSAIGSVEPRPIFESTLAHIRDRRIRAAAEALNRHNGIAVPLCEIARRVNLSPSRLRHLFKEQTGISPARYLKLRRLEEAKALFNTTFLSVKEVMARVGVQDKSHFSKDFRQVYGVTPGTYRTHRRTTGPQLE